MKFEYSTLLVALICLIAGDVASPYGRMIGLV